MELSKNCAKERYHCILELFFSPFKFIDHCLDFSGVETLEALPCRSELELLGFLITFDELTRNFDFIPELGVAEANLSVVSEPCLDLLKVSCQSILYFIDL